MTMPPDPPRDEEELDAVPPEEDELEEAPPEEAEPEEREPEPEPEPQRRPRGQPSDEWRDRRVARQNRYERENAELRERLRQHEQAQAAELQRQEAQALENARNQGPEAVAQYIAERSERRIAQFQYHAQRQSAESNDQIRFESLARSNPSLQRIADQVEEQHQRLLATDPNYRPNRLAVAKYLIGERVFDGGNASQGQQRRRAQERVQRETVRAPGNAASQVPAPSTGRRRARSFADLSVDEMEAVLANVPINSTR